MPQLGERQRIPGPISGNKQTMIWVACPKCGKERWVQSRHVQKINYTGLCYICNNRRDKKGRHRKGKDHPTWKGGRIHGGGYIFIRLYPDDFFYSMAKKNGYIAEHRLVMAKSIGRCLHNWEIVHHKNGIKTDNQIENLQLVTDDRHKQITILESRIAFLEAENVRLKERLKDSH